MMIFFSATLSCVEFSCIPKMRTKMRGCLHPRTSFVAEVRSAKTTSSGLEEGSKRKRRQHDEAERFESLCPARRRATFVGPERISGFLALCQGCPLRNSVSPILCTALQFVLRRQKELLLLFC
jgi:hypothetical protein